eukprot:CAMPEP_0115073640 /NCGR_PEP_ID=MMETSP0227-20121206/14894_1 /TAXON_ID=89957 /ORGANISM="Polarella glacialis, Strain CCMP 1383" /LENGTH=205 /DNA_ID=CAMNT_0002460513 /DNA_START=229 /DNA_END=846 /DNA_ORIENTATION=-
MTHDQEDHAVAKLWQSHGGGEVGDVKLRPMALEMVVLVKGRGESSLLRSLSCERAHRRHGGQGLFCNGVRICELLLRLLRKCLHELTIFLREQHDDRNCYEGDERERPGVVEHEAQSDQQPNYCPRENVHVVRHLVCGLLAVLGQSRGDLASLRSVEKADILLGERIHEPGPQPHGGSGADDYEEGTPDRGEDRPTHGCQAAPSR